MKKLLLVMLLFSTPLLSNCALHQQPPPGTYTPAVTRTYNADQFMKDLNALSQTARNLNATKGKEHLSDLDTQYVKDFTLAAGAGLLAYGQGATTIATARAMLDTFNLPPGDLATVRAIFDQDVTKLGSNNTVLVLVRDAWQVLKGKVSINFGSNTALSTILSLIDAQVEALPIP
jgi:hypothetical protein